MYPGRVLHEVDLQESIRYSVGDEVEQWLNGLLCLDVANVPRISSGCPLPQDCDLYPLCLQQKYVINGDITATNFRKIDLLQKI